jgi:methionyl-tRNA formyltransferase
MNDYNILVITSPDKKAYRGRKRVFSEVKIYANDNRIKLIQPEKFTIDISHIIKNFNADFGIVVSYGKKIPKSIFKLPKYKIFNIHFSLLPKYRGAAPIQHALCNGENITGVTSFFIEENIDTGNIIFQDYIHINKKDTAKTLINKLMPIGIRVMNKSIEYTMKKKKTIPQKGKPSYAPIIKKEQGLVNWKKRAIDIYNQFRGLYIWPCIYSFITSGKLIGKRIKFIDVDVFEEVSINKKIGILVSIIKKEGFLITCSIGSILVRKIQIENKAIMSSWSFIQGKQISIGDSFIKL